VETRVKQERDAYMIAFEKPKAPKVNPLLKLALEMGPLMVFFFANFRPGPFKPLLLPFLGETLLSGPKAGIFTATALFMVAMVVSLVVTWRLLRTLPIMPVVTGLVVLVFGTLTLVLADDLFIKLKPTIVNCLFGGALLGGLAFGKLLLPYVLDSVFQLDEAGWRKLTVRWGLFFFFLALLNVVVWRTQTDDVWVAFKVWGTMPITIVFALSQTPLIMRHSLPDESEEPKS
jgi:intracellular septation protein